MLDHKLTIFYHTAKSLSTTRAAEALRLSQPAVSKSIKELETELGLTLFNRERGRLTLTPAGEYLLGRGEEFLRLERDTLFGLQGMKGAFSGTIRTGASTTLSQYILPGLLARFRERYPDIGVDLVSGNTGQIEEEVLAGNIQLAFIEGMPSRTDIHYIPFLEDEIVLVTRADNPCPGTLRPGDLREREFALREKGSGTNEVIRRHLERVGLSVHELRRAIVIGTTEGIKQYLKRSSCFALVSVYSIREELAGGTLKIVDIEGMEIKRTLYAIHRQGNLDPYAGELLHFCERHKNKIG